MQRKYPSYACKIKIGCQTFKSFTFTFAKFQKFARLHKILMNDVNKTLLLCTCILAFTSILFFFKFVAEKANSADLLAQKEAAYVDARKSIKHAESQNEIASDARKSAQIAEKSAQENFTKVTKAIAELERLEAASAVEQVESAAQAKARLEREIAARVKAEKQLEIYLLRNESLERDLLMLSRELEASNSENAQRVKALEADNLKKLGELQNELKEAKEALDALKKNMGLIQDENVKLRKELEQKDEIIKLSRQRQSDPERLSAGGNQGKGN